MHATTDVLSNHGPSQYILSSSSSSHTGTQTNPDASNSLKHASFNHCKLAASAKFTCTPLSSAVPHFAEMTASRRERNRSADASNTSSQSLYPFVTTVISRYLTNGTGPRASGPRTRRRSWGTHSGCNGWMYRPRHTKESASGSRTLLMRRGSNVRQRLYKFKAFKRQFERSMNDASVST